MTTVAFPRLADLLPDVAANVADLPVAGLCLDSRRLQPGQVFLAVAGQRQHGLQHAESAVANGAAALIYDPAHGGAELIAPYLARLPCIAVANLAAQLGPLAAAFYQHPSHALSVIGVTGTNGKTSCTHYIAHALGGALPCAVMGTLGWGQPGQLHATVNTTPDALTVHAALAELRAHGFAALAMEASSHGLVQGRTAGVQFRGALFTNWSRDHLDYHGDMHSYLAAKLKLLEAPGLQFVAANLDDASYAAVAAAIPPGVRLLTYSASGQTLATGEPVLQAHDLDLNDSGMRFSVVYGTQRAPVTAHLFGRFNVDNALATLAVLLGLGWTLEHAAQRLSAVRAVAGRMERFGGAGHASVVVDYAHTPHALESVLRSVRGHCQGRLWCVFGCGGDRDRGKRAEMGALACALADQVVLTDDNPRHEDGDAIIADILRGCPASAAVQIERDRRLAIRSVLQQAQPGDVVLVAGKGHEDYQEIGAQRLPYSDRAWVQHILETSP